MNPIATWYADGQDFDTGFGLLFAHQPALALPLQEWVGRNFIPPQYRLELKRYLDALQLPEAPTHHPPTPNPQPPTLNAEAEPPIIRQTRRKWYDNTNHYRRVHALMAAATDDAQRGAYAHEIMTVVLPERTAISEVLENWEKNRILPPSVKTDTETPAADDYAQGLRDGAAKLQRIANHTTRLNKIKNHLLPKAEGDRKTELEREQLEKTTEIEALRAELGLSKEATDSE